MPPPSACARLLANNIIAALADQPPVYASPSFLRAEARWLNGAALPNLLGIPKTPWIHTILVAGQCLFFMTLCCARRCVPAWDERAIARLRVSLREMKVRLAGGEANFGMRFVPENVPSGQSLGLSSALETNKERKTETKGTETARDMSRDKETNSEKCQKGNKNNSNALSKTFSRGIERRNLLALLVAAVLVVYAAWLLVGITSQTLSVLKRL